MRQDPSGTTAAPVLTGTFFHEKPRKVASAKVTAGLICPPEMPPETQTPSATPSAQPMLTESQSYQRLFLYVSD